MTISIKQLALGAMLAVMSTGAAHAHRFWIVPSATVFSGQNQWVAFDAAISNDLFFPNYHGISLKTINITAPDGSTLAPANATAGTVRSTFELQLAQEGTYVITGGMKAIRASWKEDGKEKNFQGTIDELIAAGIPNKNPEEIYMLERVTKTYVTLGAPTEATLKPAGKGLELVSLTHPNDLFAGEEAKFALLVDGKPLQNQLLEIIAANDRYRNDAGATKVTTDANGNFSMTWPSAGRYFFEVDRESKTNLKGIEMPVFSGLSIVLEVLPQ